MKAVRLLVAVVLALLAAGMAAAPAEAECSLFDRPVDRTLNVGYAFIATVLDGETDPAPAPADGSPFTWHVELRVDRVLAGDVPDQLTFNGWGSGCITVRGNRLSTGDRIVIATERLPLGRLHVEPFSGDIVVWRWSGDRWRYAPRVVGVEEFPADDFPLAAIRSATTTADIVAIVHGAVPDTGTSTPTSTPTAGARGAWDSGRWLVFATAAFLGALAYLRHEGRRRGH